MIPVFWEKGTAYRDECDDYDERGYLELVFKTMKF
jgi:hypothetical protein